MAAVFLILLATVWFWKTVQIYNLQEEGVKKKQVVRDQATKMIVATHKEHLIKLAKPFVWAFYTELLNKNHSKVSKYASGLVKEKNF